MSAIPGVLRLQAEFARHPTMAAFTPFTIYPHSSVQAISCLIHFLGVTTLTHCISRRFTSEIFPTWRSLIHQWPRLCVVIAFADSWLFVFFAGMLLFGIGLQYNSGVCAAAIHLCIVFYGTSKIMIYAFLTEKVYLVWANGRDRLKTPAYMISVVAVGLYVVPVLLMIIGRIHKFREGDGVCIIGVSHISSLAVLSYDLFISFALTGLFLWPLLRADILNPRLRRAAFRTMIAAFISLIMSTINIAVLAALHGKEYGWLCLGSCSIDVIANALALFWVTSTSSERSQETSASQRDQKHSHIVMSRMQSQAQKGNTTTISDHASPGFAELIKSSPNAARGLQITVTSERDVDGDSEDIKKDYPDSSN